MSRLSGEADATSGLRRVRPMYLVVKSIGGAPSFSSNICSRHRDNSGGGLADGGIRMIVEATWSPACNHARNDDVAPSLAGCSQRVGAVCVGGRSRRRRRRSRTDTWDPLAGPGAEAPTAGALRSRSPPGDPGANGEARGYGVDAGAVGDPPRPSDDQDPRHPGSPMRRRSAGPRAARRRNGPRCPAASSWSRAS